MKPALTAFLKKSAGAASSTSVLNWFDQVNRNHNQRLSQGELAARIQRELTQKGESMADVKADISAKISHFPFRRFSCE